MGRLSGKKTRDAGKMGQLASPTRGGNLGGGHMNRGLPVTDAEAVSLQGGKNI